MLKFMIIARSPLRVTLGGGGTDLPSYYEKFGGFLIAAAIDRYVYITLHDTFVPDLIVKYSELERVPDATKLKHPIIREAFAMLGVDGHSLELTSMADIPSGTGLGSSGSFTTALLKALHAHKKNLVHPAELAAQACEVETGPAQRTDWQTGSIHRGLWRITCFKFLENGKVEAWPLKVSEETRDNLEDNLLLFFHRLFAQRIGDFEGAGHKSKSDDKSMIENLHFVKDLGLQSQPRWNRKSRRIRAADGRSLAAQKTAQRRHEQSKNQRVV
jgi:D-glycero-alpha-D-manno-heptose-7-phosphate kinase